MSDFAVKRANKATSLYSVLLIEIQHPKGNVYLNTGYAHIDYDVGGGEEVWQGIGKISDIEVPDETGAIEISKFNISLAGVAPEFHYLSAERVRGNICRIWSAYLNKQRRVEAIELLEEAVQERIGLKIGDYLKAVLTLQLLGNFAFLAHQSVERWTPEHQRVYLEKRGIDPESDTGFDDQHNIPEKSAAWHRP